MMNNIFRHIIISSILLCLFWFHFSNAQIIISPVTHKNEYGIGFTLSMSGFGLGGMYRKALPSFMHVGIQADFFLMRGDKEITLYDPYTGFYIEANKVHRLFLIPIDIELKRRLFANDIEDNFRPHLLIAAGAIFGMNFPRREGWNFFEPDTPIKNEYQLSYNLVLGLGVDITNKPGYFVALRPQYRFVYFPNAIAGKTNHSAFEIKIELGARH